MKSLLILLLLSPILSFSQSWSFTIHGQECEVIQNCTPLTGSYSFSFLHFPANDYNGSQMEMHLYYTGLQGGNTGGGGQIVDITSNNVLVPVPFGQPMTDCYLMDPENFGPKCCGNVWYEMGALNFFQCPNLPIQLSSIGISAGKLQWICDWTVNVDRFVIQGANNGGQWQDIGHVAGINSQSQTSYSFRLPDNTQDAGFSPSRVWMLVVLALLGGITLLDRRMAVIALFGLTMACSKSVPVKTSQHMQFYRIQEYDIGNPSPVWHSETVAAH